MNLGHPAHCLLLMCDEMMKQQASIRENQWHHKYTLSSQDRHLLSEHSPLSWKKLCTGVYSGTSSVSWGPDTVEQCLWAALSPSTTSNGISQTLKCFLQNAFLSTPNLSSEIHSQLYSLTLQHLKCICHMDDITYKMSNNAVRLYMYKCLWAVRLILN